MAGCVSLMLRELDYIVLSYGDVIYCYESLRMQLNEATEPIIT